MLTSNAIRILKERYLRNETPDELFRRVARLVSMKNEKQEKKFYRMMSSLTFLPNSSALHNAGFSNQLAACFVLPIEDSLEGIFKTLKNAAIVQQTGGGVGFSFGRIRQKGAQIKSTNEKTTGPISFMKIYNVATEELTRNSMRSGAIMGILPVNHPDIIDFVKCKENENTLKHFNISVAADDKFMKAVKENKYYVLREPRNNKITAKVKARKIFNLICKMSWHNGEPGIIFIDRINKKHPMKGRKIEATNPCSEQPLYPYESCVLGSLNLSKFVEKHEIQWKELRECVHDAVLFLDNMIDVCLYPLKKIENETKKTRKIGLGVMGFADMLVKLGISYASQEAENLAQEIMKFITKEARNKSEKLGKQKGSFPLFRKSKLYKKYQAMRNTTVTTIAPTGTLSLIADCNGGIEPFFALAYSRYSIFKSGKPKEDLVIINKTLENELRKKELYTKSIIKHIINHGSVQNTQLPSSIKKLFLTAYDISPKWHLKIQAAFQKYTDNAVSKTINMPGNTKPGQIKKAFLLAYDLGCKGVTVYRNKSRSFQVLNTGLCQCGFRKNQLTCVRCGV